MNNTPPVFVTHKPIDLLREILNRDIAAVEELKALAPDYTPPDAYLDMHRRIMECLDQHDAMKAALSQFTIEHKINVGTLPTINEETTMSIPDTPTWRPMDAAP